VHSRPRWYAPPGSTRPSALRGLGVGWRPELALAIDRRRDVSFIEVMAESIDPRRVPEALDNLRARGTEVVVHGVTLGLGDATPPARHRLDHLNRVAERLDATLISEHVAFVRAGHHEAGHLLPLPFTSAAADIVIENIQMAQHELALPLALENIASLVTWSSSEMTEVDFLDRVLGQTRCPMLLDVSNLFASMVNHGVVLEEWLSTMAAHQVAYAHVGGGHYDRTGLYHDTHAHPVPQPVYDLLDRITSELCVPAVLLERDEGFDRGDVGSELDALARLLERDRPQRTRVSGVLG
ncbi:MAG TPA: DUF692 domain-containing protein, partial [Acidimicrobiales bacterium]|nr:DUF692 domain-containing protein [Acidimicrobiales bacterium]